ncbi:hypothetical protein GOODEAATRI_001327 [Goodea atripinnis]|uniref:C2H2-type domain-containing protein n=1 Tax=Goodea atripinnis TaxID=208336 RepID=A0ABV0PJW7_9TELE
MLSNNRMPEIGGNFLQLGCTCNIKVEARSDEESGLACDMNGVEEEEECAEDLRVVDPSGAKVNGSQPSPEAKAFSSAGGIRLPNGKLKCDICGIVCIGPNVLMVHKRSHTGKPPAIFLALPLHPCSLSANVHSSAASAVPLSPRRVTCCVTLSSIQGRNPSSVTCAATPVAGGMPSLAICAPTQPHVIDQAINSAISYLGAESLRPLVQTSPASSDVGLSYHLHKPAPEGHMGTGLSAKDSAAENLLLLSKSAPSDKDGSPSHSGQDSTDTESNNEDRTGAATGLIYLTNHITSGVRNGVLPLVKEEQQRQYESIRAGMEMASEGFKVVTSDGEQVRAYRCEHCRVLFLDHVMYTIHMGCHGFRDPFECNLCGHRSQDRYEFSSHITRGEHRY